MKIKLDLEEALALHLIRLECEEKMNDGEKCGDELKSYSYGMFHCSRGHKKNVDRYINLESYGT